ncbi:MAG: SsrA-binding protein SmpB [Kiritimatiellaeota bacterium]|nr:SsrA-binding protein SmpB [Kiritimatiellota bacterium]
MPAPSAPPPSSAHLLATNRKAQHDYHILEKMEAGLALRGGEVKSIRAGEVSLGESYAKVEHGQVFLHGLHVQPYACAQHVAHDPLRPKQVLLHRREIRRLVSQMTQQGRTLVPLRLYLKRGLVKAELALCAGKHAGDKREARKRKTAEREARRAIADRTRR